MILQLRHSLYLLPIFKIDVEHVCVTLGLFSQLPGNRVVHLLAFFRFAEQILYPTEANISRFLLTIT